MHGKNYREIITEGFNHCETRDLSKQALEEKKKGHNIKTLVAKIKVALDEILEQQKEREEEIKKLFDK